MYRKKRYTQTDTHTHSISRGEVVLSTPPERNETRTRPEPKKNAFGVQMTNYDIPPTKYGIPPTNYDKL